MFRKNRARAAYLILPIVFVFLAVGLQKYPFYQRFILFLAPSVILLVGEGVMAVLNKLPVCKAVMSIALVGVVFFGPVKRTTAEIINYEGKEDMRLVMRHFKNYYQEGDSVYVNNSGQFGFGFYHGYFNFNVREEFAGKIFDKLREKNRFFSLEEDVMYERWVYFSKGYLGGIKTGSDVVRVFRKEKKNRI